MTEFSEASKALLAAWLNLLGRGYVVRNCFAKGSLALQHRIPVWVRRNAKRSWVVYIGDEPRKQCAIVVRHPLGHVQGNKRLRMSASKFDRDVRWTKAILATFIHPEMIDAAYYTSQQGMTVQVRDGSRYPATAENKAFGAYEVVLRWQDERQIWLSKSFYLSPDFEVMRVEESGKCPVCRQPLDDLSSCSYVPVFVTPFRGSTFMICLVCPKCKTNLTTPIVSNMPKEPNTQIWLKDYEACGDRGGGETARELA